jgi:hypothetical protein
MPVASSTHTNWEDMGVLTHRDDARLFEPAPLQSFHSDAIGPGIALYFPPKGGAVKDLQKCFWLLSFVLPAAAQTGNWGTLQSLPAGTNVQVRLTASEAVRGQLESVSDDALVLNLKGGPRMFARQQIALLSVKKSSNRQRNALVGLALGTGGGLAVGAAVDAASGPCTYACVLGSDAGKLIFTPLGAIVGVIAGALLPTGGWRTVYEIR